ncbi:MAG TPA: hypothetical protein VD993_08130 [Chitinophagaceae bacterium]|nr:hypothetical protein [Chitinophagaceae bacterium]
MSSFTEAYYTTREYNALSATITKKDDRWNNLIKEISSTFGEDYVRDRSDEEPSKRCVIYIYKESCFLNSFFIFHHSLIIIPFMSKNIR